MLAGAEDLEFLDGVVRLADLVGRRTVQHPRLAGVLTTALPKHGVALLQPAFGRKRDCDRQARTEDPVELQRDHRRNRLVHCALSSPSENLSRVYIS